MAAILETEERRPAPAGGGDGTVSRGDIVGDGAAADGTPFVKDAVVAARNSVTLAVALAASWAIGLVGRLLIPRYLGPEMFGALQFADSFAAAFFVISILGVDTYIRKEIAVRREHASDFFGGLIVVRVVMSVVIAGVVLLVFAATGKPDYVFRLVLLYSLYQVFTILNTSYGCVLSSVGKVGGLSIINVVGKLVWTAAIVAAAVGRLGPSSSPAHWSCRRWSRPRRSPDSSSAMRGCAFRSTSRRRWRSFA